MATVSYILGLFFLFYTAVHSDRLLNVEVSTDGSYIIKINDKIWLRSAPTFFNKDGLTWSTADAENNTLELRGISHQTGVKSGEKRFNETTLIFTFGNTSDTVLASIRTFQEENFVYFTQTYVTSANNTSIGGIGSANQTISGFPNFLVQEADEQLGFLSYGGYMFGDTDKTTGRFSSTTDTINDGIPGGPLVLFNQAGSALVISPYDNYMAASLWHDGKPGGSVGWGIMGGVNYIPANFTYTTILVFDTTIKETFFNWGNRLFERFDIFNMIHKATNASKDDSLNYLGYWTDNGAYYYYQTEPNKTYEDTLKDVKAYALKQNIPYKYLQLDSWWYPKDSSVNATVKWEPKHNLFPHGFKNLSTETAWKFVAHNRYWSKTTPYAKQNNGSYDWIIGQLGSLPNDLKFWRDLFQQAKAWGLIVYEQDWLNVQTAYLAVLQTSLTQGRDWLMQMGQAAAENGLTIQYCMANPRHALQSIEIPVVTQGRVSDDYLFRGPKQWKIGVTSLFAHAVKVIPYKDTFWSRSTQPGNPYGKSEPFPALEAAVSSLSKGPVGPSDRIGLTNRDLLMRCCSEDGKLLKPSRPALPIDKQLITDAFEPSGQSQGEMWMAQSFISTNGQDKEYGLLFAADIQGQMTLTVDDLHFNYLSSGIYYPYNNVNGWKVFNSTTVIDLTGCTEQNFCLYYFSPFLNNSFITAILGEDNKWIPMSQQRISDISVDAQTDKVSISVNGAPGENVNFWMILLNELVRGNCTLSPIETTKTCTLFQFGNNASNLKGSITFIMLVWIVVFVMRIMD